MTFSVPSVNSSANIHPETRIPKRLFPPIIKDKFYIQWKVWEHIGFSKEEPSPIRDPNSPCPNLRQVTKTFLYPSKKDSEDCKMVLRILREAQIYEAKLRENDPYYDLVDLTSDQWSRRSPGRIRVLPFTSVNEADAHKLRILYGDANILVLASPEMDNSRNSGFDEDQMSRDLQRDINTPSEIHCMYLLE